jgi:hypothetical protein
MVLTFACKSLYYNYHDLLPVACRLSISIYVDQYFLGPAIQTGWLERLKWWLINIVLMEQD